MLGLFLSQLSLFAAAALLGFALGSRLYGLANARRRAAERRDIETLRTGLSEAQVRRARIS